ncbi:GDI interacting protein 3 [Brevipalpus obovatus]|uniref:GDI interacting protein 3 n=1 Tax=Brevipalpus obovatus TaxID=246614 RepID=UPI003D9F21D9
MMKKLKNFLEEKRLAHKFSKAGSGKKLSDTSKSKSQEQPASSSSGQASSSQSTKVSSGQMNLPNPAKTSAAEAAERRMQQTQQSQQKAEVKMISYRNYPKDLDSKEDKAKRDTSPNSYSSSIKELSLLPEPEKEKKPKEDEVDKHTFCCPSLDLDDYCSLAELRNKIQEKIQSDFGEEPVIKSALMIRSLNSEEVANSCISILELILNNLRTDDPEKWEKFRRIRKAKVENKILNTVGGPEFLAATGFVLEPNGEWYSYTDTMDSAPEKVDYYLDILKSSDYCEIQVNRNSRAINLSKINIPNEQLDDAFFELAPEELSREQRARRLAIERQQTFMTEALRSRYDPKPEAKAYKYTRLRYKTMDGRMIEATFSAKENIHDLLEHLKKEYSLTNLDHCDLICGTEAIPPEKWEQSFLELGLCPTATLLQRLPIQ